MNLSRRLENLEAKAAEIVASQDNAVDEFKQNLVRTADRVRDIPLDDVLANPSPIVAYAMFYDGRVNERLVELIFQYAEYPEPVGGMFKHILEKVDAT